MTGIATGIAMNDNTVFTYSIGNFPTLRCIEQIRNDVCYHNSNVKIVAIGGGLSYGALGVSHHACQDLAIMRALPNMTVVAPGDPKETIKATYAIAERTGPCYLRCGRSGEPIVHQTDPEFEIGKAIMIRKGSDITLIAIGTILYNTVKAAELLQEKGINARVLSMHTLKPLDVDAVITAATETNAIVTVEEHTILGGLGSAVSEVLAESGNSHVAFKRIAIGDCFCRTVGSHDYLRELYSLSKEGIVKTVETFMKNDKFE